MPESHGDFIGGREFAPHPETAAQTHGRRQPFVTSMSAGNARIWPCLNHTERVNS